MKEIQVCSKSTRLSFLGSVFDPRQFNKDQNNTKNGVGRIANPIFILKLLKRRFRNIYGLYCALFRFSSYFTFCIFLNRINLFQYFHSTQPKNGLEN